MGEPKGLIDARGKPWLEHQLDSFRAAGGKRAYVVLGFQKEIYREAVDWLDSSPGTWIEQGGLFRSAVINGSPHYGPFSSITAAAQALLCRSDPGAFVLPVDVPAAGKEVWENLAQNLAGPVQACLPVFAKHGGHPVLLARSFLKTLIQIPVDSENARLDFQLRDLGENQIVRISVEDDRVVKNMNTPEDLERIMGKKPS
jgi:CTP:molybdopterin cytidylyltransferase MocA